MYVIYDSRPRASPNPNSRPGYSFYCIISAAAKVINDPLFILVSRSVCGGLCAHSVYFFVVAQLDLRWANRLPRHATTRAI